MKSRNSNLKMDQEEYDYVDHEQGDYEATQIQSPNSYKIDVANDRYPFCIV
jgi:hypothetical protein